MNYATRHTGKDNLEDDEGPCSCHQRTHAVLKTVSLQLTAKKERDLMEGEIILIRLHTKKIHIVLSMENMSVDEVSNISIKVSTTVHKRTVRG